MYQVINKTKDPRKFWNNGRFIVVGPGEFFLTSKQIQSDDVWEVKLYEEQIEQIKKTKKIKN